MALRNQNFGDEEEQGRIEGGVCWGGGDRSGFRVLFGEGRNSKADIFE